MKKNFKFAVMAFAAAATVLTSCSNDNEDPLDGPDGATSKLGFSFAPIGLTTKALNLSHTGSEAAVNTVTLFVCRSNNTLERVDEFTSADFSNVSGVYSLKQEKAVDVIAENGKKIYLGVNLPQTLISEIRVNTPFAGMNAAYAETIETLTTPNKFVMFSDAARTVNVQAGVTASATEITVSRLAAKASVKYDETVFTSSPIAVAGGTIDLSTLVWAVENQANKFRILKPDGTTSFSPAFTRTTPPNITSYSAIEGDDPTATPTHDANPKYIIENIPNVDAAGNNLSDVVTYLRIRAQFVPSKIFDANGDPTGQAGTPGATFWTVTNNNGEVLYFANATDATTWATANGFTAANVNEYTDGKCDYGVFISKTPGKYDVVRNHYYAITITAFNGIGVPPNPENPVPPTSKEKLNFSLLVNDWVDNSSSEQL